MNPQFSQKIQADFDQIAQLQTLRWDHNSHYHPFLLKHLPANCPNVLEVGCGGGEFSRLLAQRAESVTAIDLSPAMIERAKRESFTYPHLQFQVADILEWEIPDEQFNAIASIATVHHIPLETLLPRLKAALKPGGKLLILDLVENAQLQDFLLDFVAVPLNWILQFWHNRRFRPTPEAIALWREHIRTDKYLTLSQAKQLYSQYLEGAIVRRHLFWRYSMVWQKPS
ncbi:class I SAM-dependent methyltransferase [Desertifilum sp. FACHB-1129]|uniref:Methyltransferase type 11 n=2 Tax=Desertifilum tharense IPPAS B-1220 TaxID=1781255 RepID=A0A1E5QME1_9CYAN|nr:MULTISPECIES: class I SAM-dependent methyltransferase [Desertifilum]MDA0212715.1 class I SAM-dependent methyltransferase [Cyanobacteria bacterium FC1]MBD2313327.1 class I SAM-dependent methyltransferase [Desertifilum sp. FACHB-1129]MBD2324398.1 class I SAM-dependent methyltransferase [Desertifilum sp. FACHB-866]MBD2334412.1 class I SAM-dependent methyltransferase [Desertifilum sp. FACHB-868]OEJ75849.1 methyltransferase type 11 [Desertifilum tharense IPPAS B-1220]